MNYLTIWLIMLFNFLDIIIILLLYYINMIVIPVLKKIYQETFDMTHFIYKAQVYGAQGAIPKYPYSTLKDTYNWLNV